MDGLHLPAAPRFHLAGSAPLAILIGAAFALRLAVLAMTWNRAPVGDPVAYLTLAHNLLAGHGYGVFDPTYGMDQKAMYPPLYPFLLAALGTVLPLSQPTILTLNFAIDLAAAWAIMRLASELGFKPLLPAAIYLLWPSNVLFAPIANKEGLASMLAVVAALYAVRKQPVRFGAASGLLALAQPALATLPAIFALLLRVPVLVSAGTAALVLLPWWIRNYLVFGTFVPLTSASGYSLWVGTFSKDGWWIAPPPRLQVGDELRFSQVSAADAWAWISSHPIDFAKHSINKLTRGVVNGWWPVDRLVRMDPPRPAYLILGPISIAVTAMLTALGIFGGVVARSTIGKLLFACALQIVLVDLWFEFSERHTYFAIPFLSLAIAAGIHKVLQDVRPQADPAI
jgi:hypothetical protein